ncbi:MAG TPA: FtsQ-type POTRA domain-containing protein [Verrucomicrobiae bacterium]
MWFKREQRNRRLNRGHVLDVRLRSEQVRATRIRLAVMAVGVPAITIFGLYLLWRVGEWTLDRFVYANAEFAIQRVDVQTDGVIAPDQLRNWSGVKPGANLIALDLASVKRNLEFWPVLDSVSVERVLPRTLKIRVTERKPVAQVNMLRVDGANGVVFSVFQLDAAGFAMQPLDTRMSAIPLSQMKAGRLPVISGLNVSQLQPGHRVELPQARAALQLISAFSRSPMAGLADLRQIDVSEPGVVIATTGRGGEITFGLQNLEQQLRRWRVIYDLGLRNNKAIASADLAVTNNVPVRWMDANAAPVVAPKNSALAPTWRKNV